MSRCILKVEGVCRLSIGHCLVKLKSIQLMQLSKNFFRIRFNFLALLFTKKNCRSTYIVDFINLQWCTGVFDGFVCNMWKSLDGTPSAKKLSGRVIKLIYTFPAHSFNHSPPQFPSYSFVLSRDMRNSSHHPRLQWVLRQLSQNFALNFSFSKNKKVR